MTLTDSDSLSASAATSETPANPSTVVRYRWRTVVPVVVGAIGLIAIAAAWGRRVEKVNVDIKLGAPPLVGLLDWRPSPAHIPAIALAVSLIAMTSRTQRFSLRVHTLFYAVFGTAFTFALAASDGFSKILDPVVHLTEYWDNQEVLPTAGRMLQWFSSREFLRNYSVHLKGHPPGFILLLKGLSAIGLGQPWVAGALSYLGVAMMIVGTLTTIRIVFNEDMARRCAPFLALAPFAMWLGTSADAFFSGVGCVATALVALALKNNSGRAYLLAIAAGLSLSSLLFLTYAGASFLLIPGMIVLGAYQVSWSRRFALGGTALVSMVPIFGVFRGFGFSWVAGLRNTNWFYWHGTAQFRPWRLFMVTNLAAMLCALGPAVVVGIASLRRTRLWIFVGSALLCVSIASFSQYTKGEVERIWVLFYPWMVPAVAVLPHRRAWLTAQASVVIVLQMWLISKW